MRLVWGIVRLYREGLPIHLRGTAVCEMMSVGPVRIDLGSHNDGRRHLEEEKRGRRVSAGLHHMTGSTMVRSHLMIDDQSVIGQ